MPGLKLGAIADERPVRVTVTLPAALHRMLLDYAEVHGRENGQSLTPEILVPAMLERFMIADRAFARQRRRSRVEKA